MLTLKPPSGDIERSLSMHTARFYNVTGSLGVRKTGRTVVYSTANPFLFSGRVLLQTGEGSYKNRRWHHATNCRLPSKPRILAVDLPAAPSVLAVMDAPPLPISSSNSSAHRSSTCPTCAIPSPTRAARVVCSFPSSATPPWQRFSFSCEQVYIVLNRSMDMIVGAEYYSKRGYAPNGDFRYKGPRPRPSPPCAGIALLDLGIQATPPAHWPRQSGEALIARLTGRIDLTPETRVAANIEYLSSYIYKLVFNDNYTQAVSSEVHSTLSVTHNQQRTHALGLFGKDADLRQRQLRR